LFIAFPVYLCPIIDNQKRKNMKAIIEKNETYKVTEERGDFFICENNRGKVKMFAKHLVEVVEVAEMPKVKTYKQSWSKNPEILDVKKLENEALQAETGRTGTTEFLKSI
jgi:hypothetical protein